MKSITLLLTILLLTTGGQSVRAQLPNAGPPLQTWAEISNTWHSVPLERINQTAQRQNLPAQFYLAMAYFQGLGVSPDQGEGMRWLTNAVAQGLPAAQSLLGWKYRNGDGVPQDRSQAMFWLKKGAEQGFAKAQINLGQMYAETGWPEHDYEAAEKWLRKAADQGTAEAQYWFGDFFIHQFDSQGQWRPNFPLAAEWLKKAADQNYARAQYALGDLYNTGKLGDNQRTNCIPLLLAAAANGNTEAQAAIGALPSDYPNSPLLKKVDPTQFVLQAAQKGDLGAQIDLAKRYQTGVGVGKDHHAAIEWLQKAAAQDPSQGSGVGDALDLLGQIYDKGEGVPQDLAKAFACYHNVVLLYGGTTQSTPDLEFRLGEMYENGLGTEPNDQLAASNYYAAAQFPANMPETIQVVQNGANNEPVVRWVLTNNNLGALAVERLLNLYVQGRGLQSDPAALNEHIGRLKQNVHTARGEFLLGVMFQDGKLVKKDFGQAENFFNQAARHGSAEAMNRIGEMWAAGADGSPDPKEAVEWYHKASARGLAVAEYNLGCAYRTGHGVAPDTIEADAWLRLAAKQHFSDAPSQLSAIESKLSAEQITAAQRRADELSAGTVNLGIPP